MEEVIRLDWKMMFLSHWKVTLTLLIISVLAIGMATGNVLAEAIDNPFGP